LLEEGEGTGDVVMERAGLGAGCGRALDAASGFQAGGLQSEGQVQLVEVVYSLLGL